MDSFTGEKAIGTGWTVTPPEKIEQARRNYSDNVNYTVFHKTITDIYIDISLLSMPMTECMFSFWVYLKIRALLCPSNLSCF